MNVVRHDRSLSSQPVSLVHGQVVGRPGEQAGDLGNFRGVLIDVGLKSQTVVFSEKRLTDFEHRVSR